MSPGLAAATASRMEWKAHGFSLGQTSQSAPRSWAWASSRLVEPPGQGQGRGQPQECAARAALCQCSCQAIKAVSVHRWSSRCRPGCCRFTCRIVRRVRAGLIRQE